MSNRLGVHALVWVAGWSEQQCRRAVKATKACGYDVLEVPLLDPATVDAAMTAGVFAEHGLQPTCSLGLTFASDISSEDLNCVAGGEALLLDAVRVAGDIGSAYVGGPIYSAMDKYRTPATDRGRANAVAALRTVADAAAERGVTLGLEPVNRYESNLVNTAEQALQLIDDIGADNVVVHLDTYHMHIEEPDLATPVRVVARAGRLGYVHVGESHRGHLGAGSLDLPTFLRTLVDVGYDGPIVFESFSSAVVSQEFASALAVWRDLWDDSADLARSAHRLLAAQLDAARRARRDRHDTTGG